MATSFKCEIADLEEGSPCPEEGCNGVLQNAPSRNCSCHINPPCSSCVDAGYECNICGWLSSDRTDDYEDAYVAPKRCEAGSRRNEWTWTHTDNPFNSTPFTRCCGIAAIGTDRCPHCSARIAYHDDGLAARRREVGPVNCLMCGKRRGNPAISGNCNC